MFQPLFTLVNLRHLVLRKSAYLFMGEAGLGDQLLLAAAGLTGLERLVLTTVKVGEEGWGALSLIKGLTHLELQVKGGGAGMGGRRGRGRGGPLRGKGRRERRGLGEEGGAGRTQFDLGAHTSGVAGEKKGREENGRQGTAG